jgi:DNA-binding SARP family transcriptional activator
VDVIARRRASAQRVARLRFTLLGPVALVSGGKPHTVPRAQTRGLLALLLLNSGRPVAEESAIEALWGGAAPSTAGSQVRSSVHAIRRALAAVGAATRLTTSAVGYQIVVSADEDIDTELLDAYVRQAGDAARGGDEASAATLLRSGLALWRGEPLANAAGAFVDSARARLTNRHLSAVGTLADLELRLGRHRAVAAELAPLVETFPAHEELRARLMLALYRSGRQVEALQTYRSYRQFLAVDSGTQPGAELAELELAILRNDRSIAAPQGRQPRLPDDRPHGSTAPRQLPPAVAPLEADAQLLRSLDEVADRGANGPGPMVVLLTGGARAGKTALAVEWARRVSSGFPDGQLFADLGGHTASPARPIEALHGFLHALGTPRQTMPMQVDDAVALYRSLLADRHVLVVLDDARDAAQVRPLLPGGPGCLVVVTSRARLDGLVAREGAERVDVERA